MPTIGRSLLGEDGFNLLAGRLKPGQQALVVAGSGRYSFKGAAYVRGGIFDRVELIQDANSIRFRDRNHTRLGNLSPMARRTFPKLRCSCCRRNSPSIRPLDEAVGQRRERHGHGSTVAKTPRKLPVNSVQSRKAKAKSSTTTCSRKIE